ncbi:PREDICTED: neuroglobin-like [Branchiostoma belcheri]|uniref:Neuroglobin-like n=1 Tax=Branchiostoma belcheri TaxID=7741 RepID=A0A6P4Y257_BRABE|nr:PREDICTED: neuroglobin-like [Branchiostoma belcheri]
MSTDRSAVVSLAEGEKAIIRRTWAIASRDMAGNGANILLKMFEINPETKKVFAKFRDIPDNQLRSTPRFRAHVTRVMASIGTVVSALDDQEVLLDLFKDIGKKHHPPRIPEEYFDVIAGAILCMLQRCLGTDYTAEVDAAWTKLYGGLSRHAKDGLKEASAMKAP